MFKEESMVMHSNKPDIVNKIIRQLYFLKDQKRIFKDITNESFILLQHHFTLDNYIVTSSF